MLPPLRPGERGKLIGREAEKKWLINAIKGGRHIHIYGVAGIGKTSLVNVLLSDPDILDELKAKVVLYEISERGRLAQKEDGSWSPSGKRIEREIVVIDEFYRLAQLDAALQERLLQEIRDLSKRDKDKKEEVPIQFVFITDLPVRDRVDYTEPVLVFDWAQIVSTPPVAIRLLSLEGTARKTPRMIQDNVSRVRQDRERRRGEEILPPTWVLLEGMPALSKERQEDDLEKYDIPQYLTSLKRTRKPMEIAGGGTHPLWALRLPDTLSSLPPERSRAERQIQDATDAFARGSKDRRKANWAAEFLNDRRLIRATRRSPGKAPLPEVVINEEGPSEAMLKCFRGAPLSSDEMMPLILNMSQRAYTLFVRKEQIWGRWAISFLKILFIGMAVLLMAIDPFGAARWRIELPPALLAVLSLPPENLLRWLYILLGHLALGWGYYEIWSNKPVLTRTEGNTQRWRSVLLLLLIALFAALILPGPWSWLAVASLAGWVVGVIILWFFIYKLGWTPLGKFFENPDLVRRLVLTSWSGAWVLLPLVRIFESDWLRLFWFWAFIASCAGWMVVNRAWKIPPPPAVRLSQFKRYLFTAFLFLAGVLLYRYDDVYGFENIENILVSGLLAIISLIRAWLAARRAVVS